MLDKFDLTNIYGDDEGNIWSGSYYKGALKFDGVNWTAFGSENFGLLSPVVWTFCKTPNKYIMLGTRSGGLYIYDGKDMLRPAITQKELQYYTVNALAASNDSTVWVGTSDKGLMVITNYLKDASAVVPATALTKDMKAPEGKAIIYPNPVTGNEVSILFKEIIRDHHVSIELFCKLPEFRTGFKLAVQSC